MMLNSWSKHILHCCLLVTVILIFEFIFGGLQWGPKDQDYLDPWIHYGFVGAFILYLLRTLTFLSFPQVLFNFIGLTMYNAFPDKVNLKGSPLLAPFICIRVVTRGDYPQLVKTNVNKNLNKCIDAGLENFQIEVVSDKPIGLASHRRIREVVVPPNYKTSSGALFKARALQYCLENSVNELADHDWIVHLDEETLLTENSIRGILNFVFDGKHQFGQGLITYANEDVVNWITTLADSFRVADDMGKLRLQFTMFHKPLFSMKGSYVVTQMGAERQVSFNNGLDGSVAEDCFFAMKAFSQGYTFNFIDGEMWEKSPFTLRDFVQQRKRWLQGILLVVHSKEIPLKKKLLLAISCYSWVTLPLSTSNIILAGLCPITCPPVMDFLCAFIGAVNVYITSNKSLNPINNVTTSDYNKEALNYEKQIRDLKKEITDYKKKVISLQTEIDVLRNQSSNSVKFNLTDKNLLDQKNGKASPNSENKLKGCSCKGNCSNKICGCVKKNLTCQKFCRCNDVQCKNQESQKENISIEQMQLSKAGQTALEKLENLSLNQEALHASKKKVKRTMFKSHGSGNEVIEQDQIYPKNSKTIETKRRLFTQNSKELVDIDVDQDNVSTMKSDSLNKSFNNLDEFEVQAPQTPISKRTRNKKDLNGTMINNKQTKEKQSIHEKDENLEENMNAENTENFQVSKTLMMTNKKTSSQEKIYFSNKQYNEDTNSKQMLRKKSMSVSPDSCRKCKNIKVKSKSISPDKNINDHKNNDKKLSILNDVIHSSQPLRDPVQPVLYYKNNDREENEKIQENIKISTQEDLEETLESDANENEVNINSEYNINLNPMVPKHELQRSPINLTGTKILPILNKRFSSPKKELAVAEINWEQHQSELIICKICKRKFFPHRIDKHLTFCKGI